MDQAYFGRYGGRFVAEVLMPAVLELEKLYQTARSDPGFIQELETLLRHYAGRPTPLTACPNLSADLGLNLYLKREDLLHSGAHKLNNALGQALLARRAGKTRIIAETGAGQHGVATATACARLNLNCEIYMGETDMERQKPNVYRMRLLGARVHPVSSGSKTLKDAINEALRDWSANVENTHYLLGSVLGPHPFPDMVAAFQAVIGQEARQQILEREKCLPAAVIACVGGGSNAAGIFRAFYDDSDVQLIGVEAGGSSLDEGRHAARFADDRFARPGILHGTRTYILQNEDGQVSQTHSVSAGLDYPAIGPEHAWLREKGRAGYDHVSDEEALSAFELLSRREGIIPALESSHALAWIIREKQRFSTDQPVIVNLSGRGDKDIFSVAATRGMEI